MGWVWIVVVLLAMVSVGLHLLDRKLEERETEREEAREELRWVDREVRRRTMPEDER